MKARRLAGSLWLFVLVLLASAGGIAVLGESAARGTHFEPYSTFRAEPDGASALFEVLAARGFDCRRETEELLTLPDDGSLLVLVHPFKTAEDAATLASAAAMGPFGPPREYTDREIDRILAWVKRGGRLAVFECFENPIYKELGVAASGLATIDDVPFGTGKPAALSPITASGGELALAAHANVSGDTWAPLFVDDQGKPVFIESDWGEGRVYAISDPTVATNEGIARASHVEIVDELAHDAARSPIVRFDEFRHGFRAERNVMGFARRHGLHVVLVQGGLAFVLAIWAAARPRRRVRGAGLEKGMESREFVSAMANIYARAGLDRHAVASYARRCERAIALAVGGPPAQLGREEVAKRLQALGVQNWNGWESVQEEAAAVAARSRAIGERRLVSFARLATQLEREVRDAARITVDEVIG